MYIPDVLYSNLINLAKALIVSNSPIHCLYILIYKYMMCIGCDIKIKSITYMFISSFPFFFYDHQFNLAACIFDAYLLLWQYCQNTVNKVTAKYNCLTVNSFVQAGKNKGAKGEGELCL